MNLATIIILVLVAFLVAADMRYLRRRRKTCGGNCSGCAMGSSCNKAKQK